MTEKFLYEELDTLSKHNHFSKKIPAFLKDNLNQNFKLRPYQEEAFARFFYCLDSNSPQKEYPLHFLFNMATGSGKTLIMAGIILYLYKKGYRNFLFFVNSINIIEKTKNNFLNLLSSKYLFNQNIVFDTKRIPIKSVQNFEGSNEKNINICFTTIQKLHSDLTAIKENSLTYQDFKNKKIVLFSDEAHHLSSSTKKQKKLPFKEESTWENTVEEIFNQNKDNLLLEFTATLNYEDKNISQKYKNKVLYKYDLKEFRNDGWSKDVYIVQADFEQKDRILQACILNQYKQEVAPKNKLQLKPVILFKTQRKIQSHENKQTFHKMIENLTQKDIARIKNKSSIPIVDKAFTFFKDQGISDAELIKRLQAEFKKDRCLSVNEESEKAKQILLNSLEDEGNPIRAIFAVQKLTEGWDVLNLFDIVRCDETRNSKRGKTETTTMEAQLIGRGARYFPFPSIEKASSNDSISWENHDNRYKRKFDKNLSHELRILEELHYHSINDNKYISEIKQALIQTGLMDEKQTRKQLKLKSQFKATDFYKKGFIYRNKRVENQETNNCSLFDMGVSKTNYQHKTATGKGSVDRALSREKNSQPQQDIDSDLPLFSSSKSRDTKLKEIPFHIIQNAISMNDFFTFESLKKYFKSLKSIREFIESKSYLGDLSITFQGSKPSNKDFLEGVSGLLEAIKKQVQENITEYKGTEKFKASLVNHIFIDKEIKTSSNGTNSNENFVSKKDWYVFKNFYGTSEEKAFIKMFDSQIEKLKKKYDEIYLIRNEKHFKIYNFSDGQGFAPDFVLFLREKSGQRITYQMFIEPKGKHLQKHDKWKEDFLKKIRKKFKGQTLDWTTPARSHKYRLTGVPFYNTKEENLFKKEFYSSLE